MAIPAKNHHRESSVFDPLNSVKDDLHYLKLCGLPSEAYNRYATFSLVLGECVRYLEGGGVGGQRVMSFTEKVKGFLRVISEFIPIVGFPSDLFNPLQSCVDCEDGYHLAEVCREASDRIQGWAMAEITACYLRLLLLDLEESTNVV